MSSLGGSIEGNNRLMKMKDKLPGMIQSWEMPRKGQLIIMH